MLNPLLRGLPEVVIIPLASVPELGPAVHLLFAEAFNRRAGRQTAVDRLAEYFVVLLLRFAMDARFLEQGVLLGLTDRRLAEAITAIHERPGEAWSLESLARIAGMSRARFAAHFREVVGSTPFEYLLAWRIAVAQALLQKGEPLKIVPPAVGYSSAAALTRAFCQCAGISPTAWCRRWRSPRNKSAISPKDTSQPRSPQMTAFALLRTTAPPT